MNRLLTPGLAAALALPLLAATLVLPAGLDATLSPLVASSVPMLWAALVMRRCHFPHMRLPHTDHGLRCRGWSR